MSTAFCFPGQGPQEPELVAELLAFPGWKAFQEMTREITAFEVESLCGLDDESRRAKLQKNEVASLITVLHSLCSLQTLKEVGPPTAYAGYSVGQFVALHAAGCFDVQTLIRLVWQRSLLMNGANIERPGKMAAIIGLQQEQVESLVADSPVCISNFNARGQYTIAGPANDVQNIVERSLALGAHKSVTINVDGAWHSPHMESATRPFADLLHTIDIRSPNMPVVDNVTGNFFGEDIREQLVKHLFQPVQWEQGIRKMIDSGMTGFVEVGYGNMLSKFGFFISRGCKFTTAARFLKQEKRESNNSGSGDLPCAA